MDMNETYRGIDPIDMDRVAAQASEEVSRRLENTPLRELSAPRYVIDSMAAWYIDGYLDDEEMADDALDARSSACRRAQGRGKGPSRTPRFSPPSPAATRRRTSATYRKRATSWRGRSSASKRTWPTSRSEGPTRT